MLRPVIVCLLLAAMAVADEPLFSGPQAGERLPPFEALPAFGGAEKVDALEGAADSPVVIVFVHQVTRPSMGLTRLVMEYAASKSQEGLESRLVFLSDDVTDATAFLRRAHRALPRGATPLVSTEGIEGPGAYGLNRKMTLTVLVGSKGVVTANFPLVQPSVQVDAPKIGYEVSKVLGHSDGPTLEEMGYREPRMARERGQRQPERDALYRQMMAPVIQKTASQDEVAAAAAKVEELAAKTPWFRERVFNASRMISESPHLKDYGTVDAQAYLKKWAREFAPNGERPMGEDPVADSSTHGANDREAPQDQRPESADPEQ